jgi:colanic acid/amylovoran biosynthesis glycosyltransferase
MSGGRVLHVATTYGVVSETFVADAISAAAESGWEGSLATFAVRDAQRFPYPPADRVAIAPALPPWRRVVDRLRRVDPAERFAAGVAERAGRLRPGVVHAHFGWSGVYAAPLAERLGLPLVCTFHASDLTVFPERPSARGEVSPTYRRLFGRLARAFVVSRFIGERLAELGWTGPTDVLPAGTWTERFPLRAAAPEPAPPRVLYVGRLVPRKGLDVLLQAMARLPRADVRLDVVGDGPERAPFEALAASLGIAGRTTFHGAAEQAGVRAALEGAHLLVLPARTMPNGEVEGSPVILKEALAVGVPVVATRNGGTAEVVPPEYAGELVAEEDPDAMAARIGAILDDPQSWPERARVGRAWVESEFDWRELGRRSAAVYEEVTRR